MTYESFEDLPAWQSAAALYNSVLDLLEEHGPRFSSGYRNQLDRAALSVSNNIAEGFERTTNKELLNFLGIARGSAGEVRSMMAVIKKRPTLKLVRKDMEDIGALAQDCVRQIMGWIQYLESSEVQGKRHLTPERKSEKHQRNMSNKYRQQFLSTIKPEHPLYNTDEARAARAAKAAKGGQ